MTGAVGPTGPAAATLGNGSSAAQAVPSCKSLVGTASDGTYYIDPDGSGPIQPFAVWCDMTRDGGGWTLMAVNNLGAASNAFMQGWAAYKAGFGDVTVASSLIGWIGNDNIHALTLSTTTELRAITNHRTYRYYGWWIMDEANSYRMFLNRSDMNHANAYSGLLYANGMKFDTFDQPSSSNSPDCAAAEHSAWWYNQCWYVQWGDQSASESYWNEPDAPADTYTSISLWIR